MWFPPTPARCSLKTSSTTSATEPEGTLSGALEKSNRQVEQLGGVDQALFSELPTEFKLDLKDAPSGMPAVQRLDVTNLTARLEKLLVSTNYAVFVGWMTRNTASRRRNAN